MPDDKKYDSNTLSQQRKAREEFLKLKRMQNSNNDTKNIEANKPLTFKEKAVNFWYYYRFIVLGVVVLALVIAICIKQCVSRIDYDLSITIYTSKSVSEGDCKNIKSYFEDKCEDVNGDGEVNIQIYNCSYTEGGDRQIFLTNSTKLQAIIATEHNALLFITDDSTFSYLNQLTNSFSFLEDGSVTLGKDFYNYCETDDLIMLPSELKISRRTIDKTLFENDKLAKKCYEAAENILKKVSVDADD